MPLQTQGSSELLSQEEQSSTPTRVVMQEWQAMRMTVCEHLQARNKEPNKAVTLKSI
jgi:hypothetical protein